MTDGASHGGPPPEKDADASWLFSQNLSVYAGEWVAVLRRHILAHGPKLKQVRAEAKAKAKGEHPLFYSVPTGFTVGR
ncbi:MAG: hypothetical protein KGJ23_04465 [Euryarchaeota archaeon]|nr:hypothetical protein [Euryarchaeota archaeon]MDE1835853.1 hypothetical protein [Euryarchaeota archaeon]MDE1879705.1 hypothetical protein [Euryarchaeota archaeon]MDE2045828.1 hypothetical protein [Thermoplasmata archaeon]